ncbi:MAG: glycosyltransferase family 4 protein [Flavobacteriaceae bacterium]
MKVLWVVNPIFPDLSVAIGLEKPVVGGWMYGLADDLVKAGIHLTIVTARPNVTAHHCKINDIGYYLMKSNTPITDYDPSLEVPWKQIIEVENPDLVHIHGTEYAHGLVLMKSLPKLPYVISIQGLTHVIARYYMGGIAVGEVLKNITFRDIIKNSSILAVKKQYRKRGIKVEHDYLRLAKHVIGRTQWDHDHVKVINRSIMYHFCNESLRDGFYSSRKWNNQIKTDHTIFLSQAGYPLKGMHKVVEAIALIKNDFPNIKIRIAGNDILRSIGGFKEKLKRDGYGKYVQKLVKKHKLENHIEFLGFLNEAQMIEAYLNCHVFICPSSIENSPNSLGEAQILGVPCIASYVGGIPDMVEHGKTGLLYRFSEIELLSQHIVRVFTNNQLADTLSKNGLDTAANRHDRTTNLNQLTSIYSAILKQ